jgi:hypothetical protein
VDLQIVQQNVALSKVRIWLHNNAP